MEYRRILRMKHHLRNFSYQSAIEQMKSNTDYTWLAAALEALLCATMFSTMANSGVGVIEKISLYLLIS